MTRVDELTAFELASGWLYGRQEGLAPLPEPQPGLSARAVLEQAILPALLRPPCAISFSGGRDSSGVLAVATHIARREGLALPVPVTLRFPEAPESDESDWQELVVRHVGVPEWERVELVDEVDFVGPHAQQVLLRHGVLWPTNAHFHVPIMERAAGGSVLTGAGGDELLSAPHGRRVARVLTRAVRPAPKDLVRVAVAMGPRPLRYRFALRHFRAVWDVPWLRPAALRRVHAELARDLADEPYYFDEMIHHAWWPTRYRAVSAWTFSQLAADYDAEIRHPLYDPAFLAQIAAEIGHVGFENRTAANRHLFGDVLPEELCSRPTKARFNDSFFHRHSRAFVAGWDGSGVDPELVDIDVLRRLWIEEPREHATASTLLQSAWLAAQGLASTGDGRQQPVDRRG